MPICDALQEDEMGDLEDEAEKARGNADISNYAHLLDDFLAEQAQMEAEYDRQDREGQGQAPAGGRPKQGGNEDEEGGDEEGDEASPSGYGRIPICNKVESLQEYDPEVIQRTKARLAAVAAKEAATAAGKGKAEDDDEAIERAEGRDVLPDSFKTMMLDTGERWDCESVLSLRSNLENHPGKIVEPQKRMGARGGGTIKLSTKTGMPAAYAARPNLADKAIPEDQEVGEVDDESEDESGSGSDGEAPSVAGTTMSMIAARRKGESADEKKARKAAVKEAQRASRAAKKELKTMFKQEAAKVKKQTANKGAGGAGTVFVIP